MRRTLLLLALTSGCGSPPRTVGVVDLHVHVAFDPAAAQAMSAERPPTPERVVALLDDPRVGRVGVIVIAPTDPAATVAQNDALLALVRQHPRLFAVASVHPAQGEAARAELARLRGLGVRLIKLHQNTQGFDLADPAVAAVVAEAGRQGLAVMLEGTATFDPATFGKVLKLAASHPKTRFVLAHLGFADFRQMLVFKQVEVYPWWQRNVYYDLSATAVRFAHSPAAAELAWTIRELGVDRVMFGSDFPVGTFSETLAAVDALGLSEAERQAVLRGTATELLGLPAGVR